MAVLTDIMANGIQPIYESLCSYLKSSPASVTFSLFFSAEIPYSIDKEERA